MADEEVALNLEGMDEVDFTGWNGADWDGAFAHYHTDDVLVDVHGQPRTSGIRGTHRRHEGVGRDHRWHAHPGQVASYRVDWESGRVWWASSKAVGGWRTVAKWRERRHRRGVHLVVAACHHIVTGHMQWIRSMCRPTTPRQAEES